MMRPSGQAGVATDPQQKMMNQMMQYMPLMVVLFGWNFASGPVIYWVTQAFYSIVQQWLITGWGGMLDWFPWLPDLPEHRRLGYHPPRNLDDVVVVSGGPAAKRGGIQGWLMAKVEAANQHQAEVKEQREAVGIDDDTPVITYCQGGVRAAHSAISLLTSGVKNVRVYDGSWGEWGNRDDLPLEKGPAKK